MVNIQPRLAVITALPEELATIKAVLPAERAGEVILIKAGVGPSAAERAVRRLLASAERPELICSSGVCGALRAGLAVGEVVVGTEVCRGAPASNHPLIVPQSWPASLCSAGVKYHAGRFVSPAAPVAASVEKRALGAARDAIAVDTETWAIADAAGKLAAVAAVRSISDSVDDELPPETAEFLDESGGVRLGRVARYALRNPPAHVRTLWRLKAHRDKALSSLAAAWSAIFQAGLK